MSVNSSSSSNSSLDSLPFSCSAFTFISKAAFTITRCVLLLPLCIFLLHLGHQRWRQQRSFATTCHSDIFTFHLAVMELIWVLGSVFFFCGSFTELPEVVTGGFCVCYITFYGEMFFHVLTCVERYLAVVHPVTYLGLRRSGGIRIRNISVGCVWLLSSVWTGSSCFQFPTLPSIQFISPLVISLVVVSFCSVSVLRVLIRPRPGEGGRDTERVDQSKQRAFLTIMAIMGVLWLWLGGRLVSYSLDSVVLVSSSTRCALKTCAFWFNLPSSLVLPLLFLLRAGKLPCCCYNNGQR